MHCSYHTTVLYLQLFFCIAQNWLKDILKVSFNNKTLMVFIFFTLKSFYATRKIRRLRCDIEQSRSDERPRRQTFILVGFAWTYIEVQSLYQNRKYIQSLLNNVYMKQGLKKFLFCNLFIYSRYNLYSKKQVRTTYIC